MTTRSPRALAGLALLLAAIWGASLWARTALPLALGAEVAASAKPGDIMMFGATDCVYCARAARWFDWHGIAYARCEIDRDAVCAAAFRDRGGIGTPLMVVRGRAQSGWDPQAIADALR